MLSAKSLLQVLKSNVIKFMLASSIQKVNIKQYFPVYILVGRHDHVFPVCTLQVS
jgi:hypothetical protein